MDRTWEYVDRSQTPECENWDCGRAIPFLGKHQYKFLYSAIHIRIIKKMVVLPVYQCRLKPYRNLQACKAAE